MGCGKGTRACFLHPSNFFQSQNLRLRGFSASFVVSVKETSDGLQATVSISCGAALAKPAILTQTVREHTGKGRRFALIEKQVVGIVLLSIRR